MSEFIEYRRNVLYILQVEDGNERKSVRDSKLEMSYPAA